MIKKILILLIFLSAFSCRKRVTEISSIDPINWENRSVNHPLNDSLYQGMTYLSLYPEIYSFNEHRKHPLTSTVSIRNTSLKDSIYLKSANFYSTNGSLIRAYFNKPIFILPLETVEIVVDEEDNKAGTGANFIFEWSSHTIKHEPLFEAIMISTSGQQGLSFSTQGVRIE